MERMRLGGIIASLAVASVPPAFASVEVFRLRAHDAETQALRSSSRLKAFMSDEAAAVEQADAQFTSLLPRLSLEGSYQYIGTVPQLSLASVSPVFQNAPAIQFGANSSYSLGPVLRYTLWDTFSALKSYRSLSSLSSARAEDRKNAEIQVLLATRFAYIQVQLALESLRLVDGQLTLARAQDADIVARYRAGAASRLDRVSSQRAVIGYELQFAQRQLELASDLRDLLAWTGEQVPADISHPGTPDSKGVTLGLALDSLPTRIAEERESQLVPPDDRHPQIHGLELQAQASELQAESQSAKFLPTVQLLLKSSLDYPDGPLLQQINQNTLGVTLSMPLFIGDPTRHLAAERRREADSARHREDQLRVDLGRDFSKAKETLASLRTQRDLATGDVQQSEDAARLYYISYKAGKSNILDVQTANNQALLAKVNAAHLDALILNQLATLKALSAKEPLHE